MRFVKRMDEGGSGGRVSSIIYRFGQRPGLLDAKKRGVFTDEAIRLAAAEDHGLGDTV